MEKILREILKKKSKEDIDKLNQNLNLFIDNYKKSFIETIPLTIAQNLPRVRKLLKTAIINKDMNFDPKRLLQDNQVYVHLGESTRTDPRGSKRMLFNERIPDEMVGMVFDLKDTDDWLELKERILSSGEFSQHRVLDPTKDVPLQKRYVYYPANRAKFIQDEIDANPGLFKLKSLREKSPERRKSVAAASAVAPKRMTEQQKRLLNSVAKNTSPKPTNKSPGSAAVSPLPASPNPPRALPKSPPLPRGSPEPVFIDSNPPSAAASPNPPPALPVSPPAPAAIPVPLGGAGEINEPNTPEGSQPVIEVDDNSPKPPEVPDENQDESNEDKFTNDEYLGLIDGMNMTDLKENIKGINQEKRTKLRYNDKTEPELKAILKDAVQRYKSELFFTGRSMRDLLVSNKGEIMKKYDILNSRAVNEIMGNRPLVNMSEQKIQDLLNKQMEYDD